MYVPFGRISRALVQQANTGLVGLRQVVSDETAPHNLGGFLGYDDLVKAKGVLDLIVELPSFQEDLGETGPWVSATNGNCFC